MADRIPGNSLSGRKVVALAGTSEQLSTNPTSTVEVTICAELDNAGVVVVGDANVDATASTRTGVPLNAGDTYTKGINYLGEIWLDSAISGEGVTFDADCI